ncbi:MAG: FAD-binding protein [Rhodopseudomonas palustris]|nr:FAD-binding protein [Rhodopseudomonas palustris]
MQVKTIERPTKEKEAQQILARAFQEKRTVFPCGGGTALGCGILPETVDIALDMTAMNRVLAFDPQNLNLAVLGALPSMESTAFWRGREKGFSCLWTRRFQTGHDRRGLCRQFQRAFAVEIRRHAGPGSGGRGADAMGREIGFGGKTVKNVSGYDLDKIFDRFRGKPGPAYQPLLPRFSLPEASSLCDLIFDTPEALDKFPAVLRKSVWVPSAATVTQISAVPAGPGANGPRYRALIGFEGHPAGRGASKTGTS